MLPATQKLLLTRAEMNSLPTCVDGRHAASRLSEDTSDCVTVGSSDMVWLRLFGITLFRRMGIPGLFGIPVS